MLVSLSRIEPGRGVRCSARYSKSWAHIYTPATHLARHDQTRYRTDNKTWSTASLRIFFDSRVHGTAFFANLSPLRWCAAFDDEADHKVACQWSVGTMTQEASGALLLVRQTGECCVKIKSPSIPPASWWRRSGRDAFDISPVCCATLWPEVCKTSCRRVARDGSWKRHGVQ